MSRIRLNALCITVALTSLGVACVPFGEGTIRVRGELRSAETRELVSGCASELFAPSGEVWESSTPIDAQFRVMFVVAPSNTIYTLSISCPGFSTQTVHIAQANTEDAVVEQDLGAILFVPAAK